MPDAIPLLRDVLKYAHARSESVSSDIDLFKDVSHSLDDRLQLRSAPGLASWFVYSLDRAGMIYHNYNISDIWITEKGRALFAALERFPDPSLIEQDAIGDSSEA
jgi:hypothetical protein